MTALAHQVAKDLLIAIELRQFELHYQPIVELHSGRVVAQEALVRWRFEGALRYPNFFLPFARHLGLEPRICRLVMCAACEAAAGAEWPGAVSINLEPTTINLPTFPEILDAAILETKVDPTKIWLEVVELLSPDLDLLKLKLHYLRQQHRLAIDDFGSGFSNLASVAGWPVDCIKIDRSLIAGIEAQPRFQIVVSYIIEMAHALGLAVTAEGVETLEQRDFLLAVGCDYGQGWLFGKAEAEPAWGILPAKGPY